MSSAAPVARDVLVPWDFERSPLAELPARLRTAGHDSRAATMTILEGVLMFLSPPAVAATFDAVARYSAPGSLVAMTYMDPEIFEDRSPGFIRRRTLVRLMGEPFRSCFVPDEVPRWLASRGFALAHDESAMQAGSRLLGVERAVSILGPQRSTSHVALARRS